MTAISAPEAYRIWASTYDEFPNPVLALERRLLPQRLNVRAGERWLDLGTGTGWWMEHIQARGADAIGVDLSFPMLSIAARRLASRGRLVCSDLAALPLQTGAAETSVCSFALSYCAQPALAIREMARVARRVIVSDWHPEASRAGWTRSFHLNGSAYQIEHHLCTCAEIDSHAQSANLRLLWRFAARFGEPERIIFKTAGKGDAFAGASQIPAILCSAWERA